MLAGQHIALNKNNIFAVDKPVAGEGSQSWIDFGSDHTKGGPREPLGQGGRAATNFQHNVIRFDLGRAFQQIEQIEIDQKVLPPAGIDREADVTEEFFQVGGGLACRLGRCRISRRRAGVAGTRRPTAVARSGTTRRAAPRSAQRPSTRPRAPHG